MRLTLDRSSPLAAAAEQFESQGRAVTPGVDREFSPTPPPSSC